MSYLKLTDNPPPDAPDAPDAPDTPGTPQSTQQAASKSPKRHRFGKFVLVLIWLGLVTFGASAVLLRSTPKAFKEHESFLSSHTQAQITQIANETESQFAASMDLPAADPSDPHATTDATESYTVELTADNQLVARKADGSLVLDNTGKPAILLGDRKQVISRKNANAWLTNKLPKWVQSRGMTFPPQLSNMMISSTDQNLRVSFRFESDQLSQVVTMTLGYTFKGDGKVMIKLLDMKGGQLPLPMKTLTSAIGNNAEAGRIKEAIDKLESLFAGQTFDTRVQYDKHRDVVITGLSWSEKNVTMNMRLLLRKEHQQPAGQTTASAS